MAGGYHSLDEASARQAAQQEEASQAADWSVFTANGLHVDQSLLAQAHAAMLTIESEGACLRLLCTSCIIVGDCLAPVVCIPNESLC